MSSVSEPIQLPASEKVYTWVFRWQVLMSVASFACFIFIVSVWYTDIVGKIVEVSRVSESYGSTMSYAFTNTENSGLVLFLLITTLIGTIGACYVAQKRAYWHRDVTEGTITQHITRPISRNYVELYVEMEGKTRSGMTRRQIYRVSYDTYNEYRTGDYISFA